MQRQELGEALRLEPGFLSARIDLAKALVTAGAAQASLQLLEEAPNQQQGIVAVVLQKNRALLILGRKAEARKGIDQVLSVGRIPEALLQDAAMKLDSTDYAGARASVEMAPARPRRMFARLLSD